MGEEERVMTLLVELGPPQAVGQVPEGSLTIIPIVGGTFEGPGLRGRVCAGGADWNVALPDGRSHVLARYWLQTEAGATLAVENEGLLAANAPESATRTAPRFLCDLNGPYAWLAMGDYTGTLRGVGPACVQVTVWRR